MSKAKNLDILRKTYFKYKIIILKRSLFYVKKIH